MSIRSAAVGMARAGRSKYRLRRFERLARGEEPRRPLCLVYGNCQAEPLRVLLDESADFADRYETVRIPPVHEINAVQVGKLQRVLHLASLIVAQPIKDNYRELPLGIA